MSNQGLKLPDPCENSSCFLNLVKQCADLLICSLIAPYVYIHSQDQYQPSDIGAQVQNTHPDLNSTAVPSGSLPNPLTLSNLDQLDSIPNSKNGSYIYLASNDDFSQDPAYLNGVRPDANGKTDGAVSCAIIVNDKQNGTVDVYYMYFYA